jgi:hypothetical protein
MNETKDENLQLIYYLPNEKNEFERKQDIFECCENKLILKTFNGI